MSTIEEVRKWLLGKNVKGLPDRKEWGKSSKKIKPQQALKRKNSKLKAMEVMVDVTIGDYPLGDFEIIEHHYKIATHGRDAMLLFGKHRSKLLSHVVKKDSEYTTWMQKNCCDEFKKIIDIQLEEVHSKIFAVTAKKVKGDLAKTIMDGMGTRSTYSDALVGMPPMHFRDLMTEPIIASGSWDLKISDDCLESSKDKDPFLILREGWLDSDET